MTVNTDALWTIDELGVQVTLALSEDYDGQRNGSVRDLPDRRTIRYYTTLGLIDRPARMRGRTALYSRRHLLQLVAVKRLQTKGHTLAEVQQRLLGITDAALQKLARAPKALPEPPRETETSSDRADFWRSSPAPAEPRSDIASQENSGAAPVIQGVRLEEGVTLLLEGARQLDDDDIEALRVVAAPLLKLLAKRRLIDSNVERRNP